MKIKKALQLISFHKGNFDLDYITPARTLVKYGVLLLKTGIGQLLGKIIPYFFAGFVGYVIE